MNREDLEHYVLGLYEGDLAALEREIASDAGARAIVADEARLDLLLRDAAAAATFCPACDDLVDGPRCDACGAAIRPGGYLVERVLVSNAHGRMYVARDADGTQVALKELAFVQSPTLEVIAAFEREAKFLRALEHPAIPRFRASFQEGTGVHARYYLAQTLVEGAPLDARLDAHFFTEAEILGIARQVLDVLVYLQGLSPMVIHRDIKPANLLVRPDGTIAVVDFGAAHVQGSTAGSTTIGTFGYMPIEQLAGEVDATTDLYALGASLLHLLTRREPWRILQGGALDGLDHLNVSRPMRAFLARLTAPAPRDRFRAAVEARAAVERLEAGQLPKRALAVVTPRPPGYRAAAPPRSRWTMVAALAMVLVSGGGYFGWSRLASRHADEARVAAARADAERARDEAARLADDAKRRLDAMDDALRARARLWRPSRALIAEFALLTEDSCACADQRCVDDIRARTEAWSKRVSQSNTAEMQTLADADATDELAELTRRMTTCLTTITTHLAYPAPE